MKSRNWLSIGVLLGVTIALIVLVSAFGITPRLGLDLRGGTSVILTAAEQNVDTDVLDAAVDVIRNRIEGLGVAEPEVTRVGDAEIEVLIPGISDQQQAIDTVGKTALLAFRPVLSAASFPGTMPPDTPVGVAAAAAGDDFANTQSGAGTTTTTTPTDEERPELTGLPEGVDPDTLTTIEDDFTKDAYFADEFGVVYHLGPATVTGAMLTAAEADMQGGAGGASVATWVVSLEFNPEGTAAFGALTSANVGNQVAIVLDGLVQSAPNVEQPITDGRAVITGVDADEARNLAVVLKFGALPTQLEQLSVESVSPTLGDDSLRAGLIAGIVGLVLVGAYMVAYYRRLAVANLAGLVVFAGLIYVVFTALGEWQGISLTLAGVAGLIVSIGITSDSYVVYFERIKEEVRAGRTLRSAARRGFQKAFRTILAADIVSFLGAVILYVLAIGPVKGFALALGIATVVDVVVALFFTRPFVALLFSGSGAAHGSFLGAPRGTPAHERELEAEVVA